MTYPAIAPTLALGVVILVSVAVAETKLDSLAIAGRCCPAEAASCCAETVENRQPLNCSLSFEKLLSASNCIQTAIYGARSMNIARIEDVECCKVFDDDFNDEAGVCLSACTRILRSPSIRSVDKLKSIKTCRPENKQFSCFRRCQSFRKSRKDPNEKFPYLAVCNLAARLKPGVLYIGPALED